MGGCWVGGRRRRGRETWRGRVEVRGAGVRVREERCGGREGMVTGFSSAPY